MRTHDLIVSIWCVGTGGLSLANIVSNAGTLNAIAALISAIAAFLYAMVRVYHIYRHIKAETDLDDPEKIRPAKPPVHHNRQHERSVRDE